MRVILVNGSPHENGATYTVLSEVAKTLNENDIQTEIFQIGIAAIPSCRGCGSCAKLKKCVIEDDVNKFLELAKNAEGFVFGSPVHYAAPYGNLVSFMNRVFFAAARSGENVFRLKPAAAVTVARRSGTTSTFDQLNKFFAINEMPIISSRYWNMAFGANAADVLQDKEGMQIMRILGRNMAYHLHCKELATKAGLELPAQEEITFTNFIES